jgi:hypothetical protein
LGNADRRSFGSLVAAGIVARLTQLWIGQRERSKKRDDLRLELYLEVVDLILENELAMASRGQGSNFVPVELQMKQLRASHRLKLLGSPRVKEAYKSYRHLVCKSIDPDPSECGPPIHHKVDDLREALISEMAHDLQDGLKDPQLIRKRGI